MRLALALLVASPLVIVEDARADEAGDGPRSHVHATVAVGHAVGEPQSHELAWGGQLGLAYELRFARVVGLQIGIDAFDLAQGDPPVDPRFAPRSQGAGVDGVVAARLHPLGATWTTGPWIEAGGGLAYTGAVARPLIDARVGWDLATLDALGAAIGPFVGYTDVVQPSDTLRPEDAHVLWAGVAIDLAPHDHPAPPPDRDADSVSDAEDACPDVPGVPARSASTNGCPPPRPDRDADGVFDDEDACPDAHGVRQADPRANGCPPVVPDRDRDDVPDRDDACPDVKGIRTADPRTNGCPLPPDRDKDGVLDGVDACPDVPGVHTEDPSTDGCPRASDAVRVEGDQILLNDVIFFDTGSPRVRHVSWPLVKKLAEFFTANPDIEEVDIEGHADDVGASDYNLYLSRERAAAVKRLLVRFGVAPEKLTTHAYGEARPRKPGHDEIARRENRRVELTITKAREGTTPAQPQAPAAKKEEP